MPAERSTSRFEIKSEDSDASKRSRSAGLTSSNPEECTVNIKDGSISDHEEMLRVHSRKKPAGHIPRPPNAFILFRSWFIKSQHVSTEVETNHSTLSKIIGMTWQNLSEDDRQEWHVKAKQALAEHKRKFPQYAFRPIHTKPRGTASSKKTREVGPKDHKRCAKIAELVASGKTGQDLEEAIQEFDKHHVPEIVTRFETPITAQTYSPVSPSNPSKKTVSKPQIPPHHLKPALPTLQIPRLLSLEPREAPSTTPFESPSFSSASTSSFGYDGFDFSVHQPSPTLPRDNILTQAVSPLCQPYDSTAPRNSSLLHGQNDYGATEWTRNESPFSNSTISMPSTPSPIHVPFTENPYGGPYISDPSPNYASLGGPYGQYPQYSYPPLMDSLYALKGHTSNVNGGYHDFASGLPQPRMIEQDLTFSSFMESISDSSYSL